MSSAAFAVRSALRALIIAALMLAAPGAASAAVSISAPGGVVTITGDDANDVVRIAAVDDGVGKRTFVIFTSPGATVNPPCTNEVAGQGHRCQFVGTPTELHASLGGGNDRLAKEILVFPPPASNPQWNLTGDVGDGDDVVQLGKEGLDSVTAGAGADTVDYGQCRDCTGGLTIGLGGGGSDSLSGFENATGTGFGPNTITGTAGVNVLTGGPESDSLFGLAGGDLVYGGGGADDLDGGDGIDYLSAEEGDDTVMAADGVRDVLIRCGPGDDVAIVDEDDPVITAPDPDACEHVQIGADEDGDALLDSWETDGIDIDGDGDIDLDLPAMGAHKRQKDIFVELDFMAPHRLEQAAVNSVVAAFAAAPVTNPDGSVGIALHVDNGPQSTMNPRSGATWGSRSRQDEVGHVDVTGATGPGGYEWAAFDVHKAGHFEGAREQAFHYGISAHGHAGIASGNARGIPSSDFLVTLGAGCQANTGSDCTLDAQSQAGTLMHELGHNLGLRHGGNDDVRNKPSYLSVMNHALQLTGLFHADLTTSIDYSRFGVAMNEAALDEATGLGASAGSPAAGFLTLARCPNGSQVIWPLLAGPLDFNCDGTTGGVVSSDTNADGATSAFTGFSDWPAIVFRGGGVGAQGAPVLPPQTPLTEPPLTELLDARRTIEQHVAAQKPLTPPTLAPPPANAAPRSQTAAPQALRSLRVNPAAFPASRRGARDRRRLGARITYRIAAAGRVRFRVERSLPGRRAAARCVPVSRAPRGRACERLVKVAGSISHSGRSGTNRLAFSGRLGRRTLRPGRYVLVGTALSADGRAGPPRKARFTVVR